MPQNGCKREIRRRERSRKTFFLVAMRKASRLSSYLMERYQRKHAATLFGLKLREYDDRFFDRPFYYLDYLLNFSLWTVIE